MKEWKLLIFFHAYFLLLCYTRQWSPIGSEISSVTLDRIVVLLLLQELHIFGGLALPQKNYIYVLTYFTILHLYLTSAVHGDCF